MSGASDRYRSPSAATTRSQLAPVCVKPWRSTRAGAIEQIMTATDTYLLLRALCDELARCGLQHACTSPGSRSTPIVLSLVRERRIRCWSHLDERCGAFFALGAAKASARPVAVTCTS